MGIRANPSNAYQFNRTTNGKKDGQRVTTAGSRRRVPLPKPVVAALRRHRAAQAEGRLRVGAVWTDNNLVFANAIGGHIDRANLQRRDYARFGG